jgi:hypothetical protein
LHAFFLTFLYLRHDWARLVLGILFLLGGLYGVYGLVFGGLALLRVLDTAAAIIAVLEMVVSVGVSFGVAMALLKSEDISTYTSGR